MRLGLTLLCLLPVWSIGADEKQLSADCLRAYGEWIASCVEYDTGEDDPKYKALLRKPDADLAFLQGMHHTQHAIRSLSSKALAKLKTDRSFEALIRGLSAEDMFVRERSLRTLAKYGEVRCVAPLLAVLRNDPERQLRAGAAYVLREYDRPDVREALLKALKDEDWVASDAAIALGQLGEPRGIQPIYDLILRLKESGLRGTALNGFRRYRSKKTISLTIELMAKLPIVDKDLGKQLASLQAHMAAARGCIRADRVLRFIEVSIHRAEVAGGDGALGVVSGSIRGDGCCERRS